MTTPFDKNKGPLSSSTKKSDGGYYTVQYTKEKNIGRDGSTTDKSSSKSVGYNLL